MTIRDHAHAHGRGPELLSVLALPPHWLTHPRHAGLAVGRNAGVALWALARSATMASPSASSVTASPSQATCVTPSVTDPTAAATAHTAAYGSCVVV